MQDLISPGTNASFVPGGTVLTAEVIMKIRQAGLENLALECVANRKQALHAGIHLKRFDPRAVLSATELAQMRAESLVESASGLRLVLYLLLGSTTVFAVVTQSSQFMYLLGIVYLGLVFAYAATAAIAHGHKVQIIALKGQEHREAEQKRQFLDRVTQGDPEAVAEVVQEGVVGKERVISLEIGRGHIILHAILKDSLKVAAKAGVLDLSPKPPAARDIAAVRSYRVAASHEVQNVLEGVGEILSGIFAFSPSTYAIALSIYDPFQDTSTR
ncbi:MAG: hypothetical protein FJZ00_03725, partial [Candidatus Sericytochromatia bacterium]|nr:hypothetical protein [Candidatus Tanganyikabacteria bacterium]